MKKLQKNSRVGIRTLIYEEIRKNNGVSSKIEIYKLHRSSQKGFPFWLVVLTLMVLLVLFVVFIATVVIYATSRQPGTFQMDCLKRSCAPGYGLKCINSTCLCPSNDYYYSTKCELKKSFGKFCNNYQDQCKQGLICFNGKCTCHKSQYWNGKICSNKVSYGENCENAECIDSLMMKCDPSTKQCICDTNRFWSGDTCYMKRNYTNICKQTSDCIDNRGLLCLSGYCLCNLTYMYFDSTSLRCETKKIESESCTSSIQCLGDMICSGGTCQCSNAVTHYFEYKNLSCSSKTLNYTSCYENRTCRSDLGLSCQNDFCQCSVDLFWNSKNCSTPLTYANSKCIADTHCQTSLGLICNGYPTSVTCNCPTTSSVGMCDCPLNTYWNGSQCVPRFIEYENCSYSYQCVTGLSCDSCSLTCINSSACLSGWSPYYGKCFKIIYDDDYDDLVALCSSLNPTKQSQLAVADSSTFNYLKCKFDVQNSRAYISNSSSIVCPLDSSNSGPCYSMDDSNPPKCESHDCNCGSDHDAICEYTI